ncbi:MAG: right-handed parallel beta-helix repeat-containing protein [Ruminococcaceae bacterium]|nr:right-handed parallel beta-helix repeat-containing protein [Oscillospiraceae bacterium]
MKRTVALILTICMMLGTVVSVSAAPSASFTRTLNLVRLIRTLFQKDEDEGPSIGKLEDGILTVYVSEKGKSDANGTEKNPFGTITAARDAIRTLDKSEFDGITVLVKSGTYTITEPIVLTAEDSGTEDCPITYLGEDGTTVVGGISLSAKDFSPATSSASEYFPADAKGKIVESDLKKFGISSDDISEYMKSNYYFAFHPFLASNKERQTLCQYPNDTWAVIDGGCWLDENGNELVYELWTDSKSEEHLAVSTLVDYGEEYFEDISTFTSPYTKYLRSHLRFLWAGTYGFVDKISTESDTFTTSAIGYYPVCGGLVRLYNFPEALDAPGEYFIDENAILYYYPSEDFATSQLTVTAADSIIKLDNADYITLKNLDLTSSMHNAVDLNGADHLNIVDCTISAAGENGIAGNGLYMNISGNYIHDIGDNAIKVKSGDKYVASDYQNKATIYNNYIRSWDLTTAISYAITAEGIGISISHNTCHDSGTKGIHVAQGINVVVEYNHIFDILREVEDCGAISCDGLKENANIIVRYNYVHDIGSPELMELSKTKNPDILEMGGSGIYYDMMASYVNTYGNVVANIDGNGFVSNGGRHNKCTGNLFVNCSRDYVMLGQALYGEGFDDNGKYIPNTFPRHGFYYSDAFKAENPEVAKLIIEVNADTDTNDPLVFSAPAFIVSKNNWVHYNSGYRAYSNWGISPYFIEKYVWKFAEAGAIDAYDGTHTSNANMSTYSGKRKGYDLKELITETAAGVIEITWDQFETIGIVESEWNHDIEIPEKVTSFEKNHTNK